MTSEQIKSGPLVKNSSSVNSRFQKGKFSLSPVQANPLANDSGIPEITPTKKPLTVNDLQLLEACESGDLDKVIVSRDLCF